MVYEEEDFQPMQYGYHLNPDISEQRILGMLREVEDELNKKTRLKHQESDSFSSVCTNLLQLDGVVQMDHGLF